MKLVLDTSGWYAHAVRDDRFHGKAEEFLKQGHELLVLETVFEELVAILHNRHRKEMAIRSGLTLKKLEPIKLSKVEERKAWDLFQETGAKVSYVDCTVAVIAKKLDIPVFSFDADFVKLGVRIVP